MTKIMISTPAYDGKVFVQYAISLSETILLLAGNQIQTQIHIPTAGSLLVAERNRIVETFMNSDCTHLLCIDSDLAWPAQAVLAMIKQNLEFVAGIYPARGDTSFVFRAKLNSDNSIVKNDTGLLAMEYIPAGFMLLTRSVFEKMYKALPELYYEPKADQLKHLKGYCLFNTEIYEGEFWGEDYTFCRNARKSGVDIWVDPFIEFDHAGLRGQLLSVLTGDKEKSLNHSPAPQDLLAMEKACR